MNKPDQAAVKPAPSAQDRKNLKDLDALKKKITNHLERFEFHLAAEKLYHYVWHTFADKVVEEYKKRLRGQGLPTDQLAAYHILEAILLESLKMLHPFMPFVTEEIYQKFLPAEARTKEGRPREMLMTKQW